jgi:hypothetical protein
MAPPQHFTAFTAKILHAIQNHTLNKKKYGETDFYMLPGSTPPYTYTVTGKLRFDPTVATFDDASLRSFVLEDVSSAKGTVGVMGAAYQAAGAKILSELGLSGTINDTYHDIDRHQLKMVIKVDSNGNPTSADRKVDIVDRDDTPMSAEDMKQGHTVELTLSVHAFTVSSANSSSKIKLVIRPTKILDASACLPDAMAKEALDKKDAEDEEEEGEEEEMEEKATKKKKKAVPDAPKKAKRSAVSTDGASVKKLKHHEL